MLYIVQDLDHRCLEPLLGHRRKLTIFLCLDSGGACTLSLKSNITEGAAHPNCLLLLEKLASNDFILIITIELEPAISQLGLSGEGRHTEWNIQVDRIYVLLDGGASR